MRALLARRVVGACFVRHARRSERSTRRSSCRRRSTRSGRPGRRARASSPSSRPTPRSRRASGAHFTSTSIRSRQPGMKGADDMRFMALQAPTMLSFDWNAPPHLAQVRQQRTFVVVRLKDVDGKSTRVTPAPHRLGRGRRVGPDLRLLRPRLGQRAGQPEEALRDRPAGLDRAGWRSCARCTTQPRRPSRERRSGRRAGRAGSSRRRTGRASRPARAARRPACRAACRAG